MLHAGHHEARLDQHRLHSPRRRDAAKVSIRVLLITVHMEMFLETRMLKDLPTDLISNSPRPSASHRRPRASSRSETTQTTLKMSPIAWQLPPANPPAGRPGTLIQPRRRCTRSEPATEDCPDRPM